MKVEGIEIRQDVIDHALSSVNKDGFTLAQLDHAIERAGGPYPLFVANRAADRVLQKLRKSGALQWTGKVWKVPEHQR